MQLIANTPSAMAITGAAWKKIEAKFRLWSFHIYYDRSYATEINPTLRFVKALIASTQPIRDRNAVIQWYRQRSRQARRPTQAC